MTILNTVLFGVLASLVTLKVALLAAAAVLFVQGMLRRYTQHKPAPVPVQVRRRRLDVRV